MVWVGYGEGLVQAVCLGAAGGGVVSLGEPLGLKAWETEEVRMAAGGGGY